MIKSPQVFQTNKTSRWNRVKWTSRIMAIVGIFLLVVLAIALVNGVNPSLPNLQSRAREYQNPFNDSKSPYLATDQNKKYKGFKDFLFKKQKEDSLKKIKNLSNGNNASKIPYIRSAFYTPW